jgi:hypothetical protein
MTRDDIIRMAHEVGMILYNDQFTINHGYRNVDVETMKKFANLIAAAEREACADMVLTLTCMGNAKECFEVAATYIRARGQE